MSDPYIYTQLNTKKLSTVTAEEIMNITDPTHIEFENEFNLERYNLINKALYRDGQPMPNTQRIVQTTYTGTSDDADFFKPNTGEVWMLVGGDTLGTGGTGTISFSLKNDAGQLALLFIASVNGQEPIGENSTGLKYPIYVSSTNWLYANITAVATSVRASLSFIRVR